MEDEKIIMADEQDDSMEYMLDLDGTSTEIEKSDGKTFAAGAGVGAAATVIAGLITALVVKKVKARKLKKAAEKYEKERADTADAEDADFVDIDEN